MTNDTRLHVVSAWNDALCVKAATWGHLHGDDRKLIDSIITHLEAAMREPRTESVAQVAMFAQEVA